MSNLSSARKNCAVYDEAGKIPKKSKFTLFETILIVLNILIGLGFLVMGKDYSLMPLLGFTASVSNTLCVILVAKRQISNYWWGILGTLTYGIVAFNAANTGEWTLNFLYYLPMNFIGWYMWNKNSEDKKEVKSKSLSLKQSVLIFSLTAVLVFAFAYLMALPQVQMFLYGEVSTLGFIKYLTDSLSTVLSIVAMILMVKCYREQWILWIVVNIASIILWCFTFDLMMILLWSTLLVNSVYGYIKWKTEEV
jgi:nicotinamide mononucleotide transporter